MNWDWRLFLDYITVLRWPALVLVLVLVFRAKLRELLNRITGAEGPGGFKVQLAEARATALEIVFKEAADEAAIAVVDTGEAKPVDAELHRRKSASASTEVAKQRLGKHTIKATTLNDVLTGWQSLESFDEVVVDMSSLSAEYVLAAGMFAVGLQVAGTGEVEVLNHDIIDGTLRFRHLH